jgi:hypothetical protein
MVLRTLVSSAGDIVSEYASLDPRMTLSKVREDEWEDGLIELDENTVESLLLLL